MDSRDRLSSIKYITEGIVLGQILAICNAGTGVTSQLLTDKIQVKIPTTQSFLTYLLVAGTYGTYHLWHHGLTHLKSKAGLWCLFLACTDFVATYVTVKAYQYTSLVSVQLLDCLSIPTIMISSCVLFKTRYKALHYVAVVVCLCGVGIMVFVDSHNNESLKGDLLVVCAAVIYGINNVCLEWLAKDIGTYAYLGMYCWFGLAISAVQVVVLERIELKNAPWHDPDFYLALLGFTLFLFLFLSLMPIIMVKYSATVANLNLLAADVYSAVAGYAIFSLSFSALYLLSIVMIIGGVLLYIYQSHVEEQTSVTPDAEESTSLVIENGNVNTTLEEKSS